ncbi:MAG: hypothetical protein VKN33_09350 [Candidatus Sericytochromatia bacterium]|nr:hypothetical protein [Candidatus Sericytochromatia bacterium]
MGKTLFQTVPAAFPAAVLGDGKSVGLLRADGSINALAFPDRAGESWFGADATFTLAPVEAAVASFEYVGVTPVLQTTWQQGDARACVTDFMPLRGNVTGSPTWPRRRIIRIVEALDAEMDFRMVLTAHLGGEPVELLEDPEGVVLVAARESLVFQTSGEVLLAADGVVSSTFRLARGERRVFVLTWHPTPDPEVHSINAREADWELDGTLDYWMTWERRCPFNGVQRAHVMGALVLLAATGGLEPNFIHSQIHFGAQTRLLAAAALSAWGYEEALAVALRGWSPQGERLDELIDGAQLLSALAQAAVSGLIEARVWLPHLEKIEIFAQNLSHCVMDIDALKCSGEQLVALALALDAVFCLEEEGLWRADTMPLRAAQETLKTHMAAVGELPRGWRSLFEPTEVLDGLFLDDPGRPILGWRETLWAVRLTLRAGAYTQARRAMDRFWLTHQTVFCAEIPDAHGADHDLWAHAAWLSALIYLVDPPTPGRLELPDEWDW